MFSYLLSIVVAFLFFGTLNNILLKMDLYWYFSKDDSEISWVCVSGVSLLWGIFVPLFFVLLLMFLLKLLTDKISMYIINYVRDRKVKKASQESLNK